MDICSKIYKDIFLRCEKEMIHYNFILLLSPQDGNPVIWLATGADIQAHLDIFDPTQAALNNYNFTYSSL